MGKDRFGLNHLPQGAIEGLYGIGGVDDFADGHGVVKYRDDMLPMANPDLADGRELLVPLGRKSIQGRFRLLKSRGLVNRLEVREIGSQDHLLFQANPDA